MEKQLHLEILPQPDDTSCGATCLQAIYNYHGHVLDLDRVIDDVRHLEEGGTLGVFLADHALGQGYKSTIYAYDLRIFDPSWFGAEDRDLVERLSLQMKVKRGRKFRIASRAYIDFLRRGGEIRHRDLTADLIRRYLNRSLPIIAGLSATHLYGSPRERGEGNASEYDDIRGVPVGHFVVLCGYNRERRTVSVADPYLANPLADQYYEVDIYRLIAAILLGVVTYDANLIVIEPVEPGHE